MNGNGLRARWQNSVSLDEIDPTIVGFRGRDIRSRAFNLLRSRLTPNLGDGKRVIGITSAAPHVGKTFIACNLAASLSRLPDIDTYLIDLDLRRGLVAERFGIVGERGISDYLRGEEDNLADLAWGVDGQKLTLYPTFDRNVLSSELLAGSRMTELMRRARSQSNSVVICDLPPVFANDDTLIIIEQIDLYLFVIEDGATTEKQVKSAIELIGREKFGGTILNKYIRGFSGDSYGYGYGDESKYSKYYS